MKLYPSPVAIELGYDDPKNYQWPGKEVCRFTTKTDKKVIQFLLHYKNEEGYVLKTWNELLLIEVE